MRKAYVTGATGFVGGEIARQLCEAGWQVSASRRRTSSTDRLSDLDIEWVETDLCDPRSVSRGIPERVDAVFHSAGNVTFWPRQFADQVRDNVHATTAVVEASLARSARRFVFTSSAAAYGQHDTPLREDLPSIAHRSPVPYDQTKYLAEQAVRAGARRGLEAVILNPSGIFGPGDEKFTQIFQRVAEGKLPAAMPARTSFCDVRQVARAHLEAVERGRVCQNYLLGGPNTTQLALTEEIARQLQVPPPRGEAPRTLLYLVGAIMELNALRTGRPPTMTRTFVQAMTHCWYVQSDLAIAELGYRPTPLHTLIEDTLVWMHARGRVSLPARAQAGPVDLSLLRPLPHGSTVHGPA